MRPISTLKPAGTPLWAAFGFTFLSSIGTGVVTSGIYFLTDHTYGFSGARNCALGVVMGLAYIAGAAVAGPSIRGLRRIAPWISTRGVLAAMVGLMAILCASPEAGIRTGLAAPGTARGEAVIWLVVALYNPLSGALWPIVESYVSGGRPGPALRSAVSKWNIVWSSALVVAFWGLAPLTRGHGATAILLLGVVHLASLFLLARFGAEPGAHDPGEHGAHPDSYPRLLTVFRLLLPTCFMVLSSLSPYLPGAMARLGVAPAWQPALATAWLIPRCLAFWALDRWARWHGSWAMPVIGGILLLGGFAMSILAPLGLEVASSPTLHAGRLGLQLAGLAMFGVGVAAIYAGAVYYALEVGQAGVDAGGKHESLIGVGYTAGPLFGLAATMAAERGFIAETTIEWGFLLPVSGVALAVGLVAFARALRGRAAYAG